MSERTNLPHFILDGYNFILRQERIASKADNALWEARERLIRRIVAFRGQKRLRVTIVFDGQDLKGIQQQRHPAGIEVVFSRAPQKADPAILELIRKSRQPRNITVITSDQALARIAAGAGCSTMTVELFDQKMITERQETEYEQKYQTRLSQKELDEWLKLFDNANEE